MKLAGKTGCEIRIGTSGWHYKHWRGPFYPENCSPADMLQHYTRLFDSVEINNSFYRLPERGTFEAWHDSTPAGFKFAVKASRFITHNKKLKDPEVSIARLFANAEGLAKKFGPVLFQFPPHWGANPERLAYFLRALPHGHRYVFEFREPSWNREDVFALLRQHHAACCIYELAGFQSPLVTTANWVYVRLHGPGGKYQGRYSSAQLAEWAERIVGWTRQMRSVYLYFDNDQAAYAAHNALQLKTMLAEQPVSGQSSTAA